MGITTAMLVGAGIKGAIGLYNAHKASSDAKKVVAQQQTGADEAMKIQRDLYQQQQQALSPYTGYGGAAMGTLGYAMGLTPMGGNPQAPGTAPPAEAPGPQATPPNLGLAGNMLRAADRVSPGFSDRFHAYNEQQGHTLGGGLARMQSSLGSRRMQAPDGSVEDVPEDMVQHYSSLGAKELAQ